MIQKLLVVQCMVASSVVASPVVRTMAAQARDPSCVQFQMNATISLSFYYKILFVTVNIKFGVYYSAM